MRKEKPMARSWKHINYLQFKPRKEKEEGTTREEPSWK